MSATTTTCASILDMYGMLLYTHIVHRMKICCYNDMMRVSNLKYGAIRKCCDDALQLYGVERCMPEDLKSRSLLQIFSLDSPYV